MGEPLSMEPINRQDRDIAQTATARTLELVAEWLGDCATDGSHNYGAMSRAARELRSGAFDAWLKERETRGG